MKKTYMQPQVELTLLAAATALLGISAVQQLHDDYVDSDSQQL